MTFPAWVEHIDLQTRASNRLRFLINRAAILTVPGCTISGFADYCGVNRSQVQRAISAGAFPALLATSIEKKVGRGVLCHEHLMNPLEIENNA